MKRSIKKIKKSDLKKQLSALGIKIVKSNYIRKKDIEKIVLAGSTTPRVYVGTYGKYNDGSIDGAWLDLEDYADKEDFYEAAKELHKDENDPELMFQDFEGFPKRFYGESYLADELWGWLELNEEDRELLEVYIDETGDGKATIEQARDAFAGKYDSEEDWAEYFLEETGGLIPDMAASYLEVSYGDIDIISSEEADDYIENADDEAILKEADMLDEYDDEEDENKKEKILEEAKETVRESRAEENKTKLEKDPVGYFVDEIGYTIEDLLKANFITIDYKRYARDAASEGMSFVHKDGDVWVFNS